MLAVLDLDLVAGADQVARDVELPAVDGDVPVGDHLPGLRPAGREPEAGHHVVEPALEQRHQGVAGIAGPAGGQLEILAELALEDPVVPLDLLLLAEPDRIFARLAPAELVHARHALAAVDRALRGVAARPLQEQLQAFPAAEPADRSDMASHDSSQKSCQRSAVSDQPEYSNDFIATRGVNEPSALELTAPTNLKRGVSWGAGSRCGAGG